MKKEILIVFTGAMELGGIERSLLGLLDSLDYEKYDVDLFLYGHHGLLFDLINKNVNLLPEVRELSYLRESLRTKIKNGCYYSALLRVIDEVKSCFGAIDNDHTWAKIMRKYAPVLEKDYDLAISFFLPFDFIKEKVKAKLKVGWIHTDYNGDEADREALFKNYRSMDYIAAVSEQCKESFCEIFPQLSEKTITIENVLSAKFIKEQAKPINVQREMPQDGSINLLSVGRFCEAKNFDNVPDICNRILKKGLNIKWYLIGYGGDENLIRTKIKEAHMEEHVIILGKKVNPYPYIKACDLYVQPSRYEGKCVSVIEAQVLNKPVIITNYATSDSQLKDGYDGIIVPMDNEECAQGIVRVINNEKLQQYLIENTKRSDYTNVAEIDKLYQLMEKSDGIG